MKRFFALFFVLLEMTIFAETWNYEMQKITIPTGKPEDEILVEKAAKEDMLDVGPTEFQIDEEENIYILDRRKIKKFDENGNYLNSTSETDLVIYSFVVHNNMIWAICGDHLNQVFLRRFSDECELIDTHQIENRKSSLEINQSGNVGLRLSYDSFLEFSPDNDKLEMKETKFLKDVIFDFSAYQNKQDIIFLKNNERLDLKVLWPNAVGFHFSGLDAEGNLYFELFTAEHDSEIGIISNEANVYETNIKLPNFNKFGLDFGKGIDYFISTDGDVYQMIPMTDKIEIRKWKRMD
ncbi:MAG: hypothetical protein K9N09_04005 [Candidatus Cloacimonetes bacterium]|nr:hypothetical protein [Candidatus Cloacimonadota bacterium]MCF7813353.1 hypothetical protein [Candidatus Cloacimonadota bacterium]MCF7867842.1 hypothetical protein [Candidatus Cloacimonadota bacterium]MCF7883272.1 hypothetical protein [Candidatus Cloacimonadota bacterium]